MTDLKNYFMYIPFMNIFMYKSCILVKLFPLGNKAKYQDPKC